MIVRVVPKCVNPCIPFSFDLATHLSVLFTTRNTSSAGHHSCSHSGASQSLARHLPDPDLPDERAENLF